MFESDGKKQLKNKYKNLSGSNFTADMCNPNSVYGELKLSEKLSNELNSIRDIVNELQENLEEERFMKDTYYEEIQKLKEDLKDKEKQF
jgi:gas vesicle protein